MSDEYLINFTPQETRVALMQQGVVQEVHVERTASRGIVGNIYLGRVVRVLPGMQSAFMDVGLERTAFLHVADIWCDRHAGDAPRPIERILAEGQNLMVQVLKDPLGTKGARLSTQISIAGRMLVFLPQDNHLGISQKIGSAELREQLRPRLQKLTAMADGSPTGGFILRTNAEDATDEELADDIAYLRKAWGAIRAQGMSQPPGTLLPVGGTTHGHKGYGLALLVEALTAGLAGHGRADPREGWGATVYLTLHDLEAFGGQEAFLRQMDHIAAQCRGNAAVDAARPVRLPGDNGLQRRAQARHAGLRLHPTIAAALAPAQARYGLRLSDALRP